MDWYLYRDKSEWKISSINGQGSCMTFTTYYATFPLVDGIPAKEGETSIASGKTLALDESFSVVINLSISESVIVNDESYEKEKFDELFIGKNTEVESRGFGMYTIEIENSNGSKIPPLVLEIYPGYKIGYYYKGNQKPTPKERYEEAHKFFQAMVAKLADSDLVLSLLDPAAIRSSSWSKGETGSAARKKSIVRTVITDYWFFVKHGDTISKALKHIQRFPHKVLGQKKEFRRIDTITSYDPDLPYEISKAPQYLQPLASPNKRGVCEKNGKRHLPEQVLVNILEETFDNPENRFLMHVVSLFHSKLKGVLEWLNINKNNGFTKKDELEKLRKEIASFQRHPDFQYLLRSATEPSQSKVLTKTPGYKEMASIWRQYGGLDFNGGLLFIDTIIRQKRWHDLYELWCFKLILEKLPEKKINLGYVERYSCLVAFVEFEIIKNKTKVNYALAYQGGINNSNGKDICRILDDMEIMIDRNPCCKCQKEIRPDFLLFKQVPNGSSNYELCYIMDAKFSVAESMPTGVNIQKIQVNTNLVSNFKRIILRDIYGKYLFRFKYKKSTLSDSLFGCGLFLEGVPIINPHFDILVTTPCNYQKCCIGLMQLNEKGIEKTSICSNCQFSTCQKKEYVDLFY